MKLTRVYVDNYRNLKNCSLRLSDPDILVGENNVGKTNLLNAIGKILTSEGRVYFSDEDFADPGKPIVIELTFSNFTDTEDEAIFYDQEGTKNPETNEVKVRLKAEWNERERDIALVCQLPLSLIHPSPHTLTHPVD